MSSYKKQDESAVKFWGGRLVQGEWDKYEIDILKEFPNLSDYNVAQKLRRKPSSVRNKRLNLRREQALISERVPTKHLCESRKAKTPSSADEGMQLFNFEGYQVRSFEHKGEPWIVLSDVCKVLGIGNVGDTKKRLDQSDIDTVDLYSKARNRTYSTAIVNESGLYDVILDSRKPQAKQFRRWVTSEVLPAIRKHGGYLTEQKIEEVLLNPDTIIQLAQNLKTEQKKRAIAEAERAAAESLVTELEPKANHYNRFMNAEGTYTWDEVARIIGVGRNKMLESLRIQKVLMTGGNRQNLPYQSDMHRFEVKEKPWTNPATGFEHVSYDVRVKPEHIDFIAKKCEHLLNPVA